MCVFVCKRVRIMTSHGDACSYRVTPLPFMRAYGCITSMPSCACVCVRVCTATHTICNTCRLLFSVLGGGDFRHRHRGCLLSAANFLSPLALLRCLLDELSIAYVYTLLSINLRCSIFDIRISFPHIQFEFTSRRQENPMKSF